MTEPLWRECVYWLDQLKILRSDQFPSNELINFVQYMRDGVLLCHLITKLDSRAVDFREVFQRTQMSQVNCYALKFKLLIDLFKLILYFSI